MSISPGSKLGPYEISSLLGAGGMGEVYRARDPRLGREVAIKVLPAERMADESRRRRFVQEARAASALNHPNIVTVHEVDSVDGIDFIVMEYVRGPDARATRSRARGCVSTRSCGWRSRSRTPSPARTPRASSTATSSPANVMVSAEGTVKVLDFGLAKLVTPRETSPESETATDDGERAR